MINGNILPGLNGNVGRRSVWRFWRERSAVSGMAFGGKGKDPAHRCHYDSAGSRARHCAADYQRKDRHHHIRCLLFSQRRVHTGIAVPDVYRDLPGRTADSFCRKTAFGLFLESVGCNPKASKFAGIQVDKMLLVIYTISGAFAAVAGLIESSGIKGADCNNAGLNIELDAILAVAIGGTNLMGGRFSIPASIAGALIVQSITTTVLALGVPAAYIRVLKAVLIIVICLSQSKELKAMFTARKAAKKRKVVGE